MTTSFNLRSLAAASTFAAVATFAIIAQSGTASAARNPMSCDGTSRSSVIECCETLVKSNGLPFAMKRAGKNCRSTMISCSKYSTATAAAVKRCHYVTRLKNEDRGKNDNRTGRTRGGKI